MKHLLMSTAGLAELLLQAALNTTSGANAPALAAPPNHTGSVTRAHHRRHAVQSARNQSPGDS